jgi:hypothetical protein
VDRAVRRIDAVRESVRARDDDGLHRALQDIASGRGPG